MRIGITGASGFIGYHLCGELVAHGHEVIAIDSLRPAYASKWSLMRTTKLASEAGINVLNLDIVDTDISSLRGIFSRCDLVVHLAAWPGVRQSMEIPDAYARENISSFSKISNAMQHLQIPLFFASSSSVYGDAGTHGPTREIEANGTGLKSYYALTKWINEVESLTSQKLFGQPALALRFFTVFGSWGRPDMAYWKFAEKILSQQSIPLYGATGGMRSFTHVSDAVSIVRKLIENPLSLNLTAVNVANTLPKNTLDFVSELAKALDEPLPLLDIVPRPSADAEKTWASTDLLASVIEIPDAQRSAIQMRDLATFFREMKELEYLN
jgi:UDP-glucuronate 4-epimerase